MSVKYNCYRCGKDCDQVQQSVEFGVPVYRCNNCQLIQTQTLPASFLSGPYLKAYSDERKTHVSEEYLTFAKARGEDQRAFVEQHAKKKTFSAVLDFGGGFGGALAAFPDSERCVYELDPVAREHLATLDDVKVLGNELFSDDAYKSKFDLIILSHVLEHMRDPIFELERMQALLSPNGLIFIEVPTEDETVLRLQTENLKPGLGHVFHFERKTFKSTLEDAQGFDLLNVEQCGISKIAFYEQREKMKFGVGENPEGLWLRAVLRRGDAVVEAKPRAKKSTLSIELAQNLFKARSRELKLLTTMRKTYKQLEGSIRESVPSAESVIGLDHDNFEKLFFMGEKARRESEHLQKQAVQSNSGVEALEKAMQAERELLRERIASHKEWAEKELAETRSLLETRLSHERTRVSELQSRMSALTTQNLELERINSELVSDKYRLERQITELEADRSALRDKSKSVNEDIEALKVRNDELESELKRAAEEKKQLEQTNSAAESKLVEFRDANAALESAVAELDDAIAELKARETALDQDIAALNDDKAALVKERDEARSSSARLQAKTKGKLKLLRAELDRERAKVSSLREQLDVKRALYEKQVNDHYAAHFSKFGAEYEEKIKQANARHTKQFNDFTAQHSEKVKAVTEELNRALDEANGKVRRLAQEHHELIKLVDNVQNSTTFKVGAAVTFPARFLKNRKAELRQTLIEVPTQNDLDRKAAKVTPKLPKLDGTPKVPDAAANGSAIEAFPAPSAPAIISNVGDLGSEEKAEFAVRQAQRMYGLREFFKTNGFAVVRNLLTEQEARSMARQFKSDLVRDPLPKSGHSTFDVASVYPPAQDYVFDPRVLNAVRSCIGDKVRFLQWATYQVNHMSFPWHRDCGYRKFNVGNDWDESEHEYRIAKVILYFECQDFAMGLYPGTHKGDLDRTKIARDLNSFKVVDLDNQRAGVRLPNEPHLAAVKPGDALIFDQRLFHCGRLTSLVDGEFTKEMQSDKSFLSLLYGADNPHSARFYSYFNHERQFGIRPMQRSFVNRLKDADLYLSTGQSNYYDFHPEQRAGLWLPEDKLAHSGPV